MKKINKIIIAFLIFPVLSGCGISALSGNTGISPDETADISYSGGKLVVYFSRIGENYSVGVIDKGNTAVVADIIAEKTNADKFEIVPVNAYPESYNETLEIAQREATEKTLPEYQGDVENWAGYDTVFIGYPIWYGDMPRIVYTFLEYHDWTGKTVVPFDTHAGSGLAKTESTIASETGANVLSGLAVRGTDAQKNQEAVREEVQSWLDGLKLNS